MSRVTRPDSVLEATTIHVGHNCVACVAAVLYNELGPPGFATANMVAKRFHIAPSANLPPLRAVRIFQDFAHIRPSDGRSNPWDGNAPDGHFAVFCLGRRHVIYGYRESGGYYLYDPQLETDHNLSTLLAQGYGPFLSYHFA